MVASSGDRLLDQDAEAAYLEELFPHALIVTPNLREASLLVGRELSDVDDMAKAAIELAATGARNVLVKGGDYRREEVVGHDLVEADGGEVILIDLVPGFSTTRIVRKSRAAAE